MITSNRAFQEWPTMFNHASTVPAALLDRLLPHADTVVIAGKSFRMRGHIEPSAILDGVSSASLLGAAGAACSALVAPTLSNQRFSYIFTQPVTGEDATEAMKGAVEGFCGLA